MLNDTQGSLTIKVLVCLHGLISKTDPLVTLCRIECTAQEAPRVAQEFADLNPHLRGLGGTWTCAPLQIDME